MTADDAEPEAGERTTAPQSDYGSRDVGLGIVVFLVGAAVAFGIPIAMTL